MKTQELIDFLEKEKYDFVKNNKHNFIEITSFGIVEIEKYGITFWEENYYILEDLKVLQKMIEYATTTISERK